MKKVHMFLAFALLLLTNINAVSASSCVSLNTNLRTGMKSSEVTLLQNYLNIQGYNIGQATGFFGQRTLTAVRAFQTSVGLPPSGFVGNLTRNAIQKKSCGETANTAPIACTMEMRICPDGSNMERSNTTCEWFPNKCAQTSNSANISASATYWSAWDTTQAKPITSAIKASIEAALKQAGVTDMSFGTTTLTSAEIIEQTKKLEQAYILRK